MLDATQLAYLMLPQTFGYIDQMTFIMQTSIHLMQNTASIEVNMNVSNAPVIAIKNTNRILGPASAPSQERNSLTCAAQMLEFGLSISNGGKTTTTTVSTKQTTLLYISESHS